MQRVAEKMKLLKENMKGTEQMTVSERVLAIQVARRKRLTSFNSVDSDDIVRTEHFTLLADSNKFLAISQNAVEMIEA